MTTRFRSTSRWLALGVLMGFCLIGNIMYLCGAVEAFLTAGSRFDVSPYQHSFDRARSFLRPDSVLGYLSDRDDWVLRLQTQYALAPVIVEATVDRPYILANLHGPYDLERAYPWKRFFLVRDFGDGVLLLGTAQR